MDILSRFINYVKIDTRSVENSKTIPSTPTQLDLIDLLDSELKGMGINTKKTNMGILYAKLESNSADKRKIGFISHVDTAPDVSGFMVKPQIIKNYSGEVLKLKDNIVLDKKALPSLNRAIGKTLITTDGTTLLGGDDKAGVADIMDMLEYYVTTNEAHCTIFVAFTPDEEIGGVMPYFDLDFFDCDFAYTVDGGEPNTISYDNFNAVSAVVDIKGLDIHPGTAKGKMINASLVGMEFQSLLPVFDNPMYTEKHEGFNHLVSFSGETGEARLVYIIRNHDMNLVTKQKNDFYNAKDFLNKKYGYEIVSLNFTDGYKNMKEIISKDMTPVNTAVDAIKASGFEPFFEITRGGTDGATLTNMGLSCPNLGTGSYNHHGQYEIAILEEMMEVSLILKNIVKADI